MCHADCRVAPYARLHLFTDIAAQSKAVEWTQGRVDFCHEHLPAGHTGVFLLVGVWGVVPLPVVCYIIGYQFLECVILLVLPCVIAAVADFLLIHTACPFIVPTTHSFVVLMGYCSFERSVQWL